MQRLCTCTNSRVGIIVGTCSAAAGRGIDGRVVGRGVTRLRVESAEIFAFVAELSDEGAGRIGVVDVELGGDEFAAEEVNGFEPELGEVEGREFGAGRWRALG